MAKDYFTQKELMEFKNLVEDKKELLIKDMKNFEDSERARGEHKAPADISDAASEEIASTLHFRIHDKNRKLLSEVNAALKKFESGEYGICEGTGDYISKKRLKIRPWTRYSIEYKEHLDEEKRLANR